MKIFYFIFLFIFMSCTATKEEKTFYKLGQSKPKTIGAIQPSSKYLAQKMTSHIQKDNKNRKFLDVGAGIGTFSDLILKKMGPKDQLDLIEIEPSLCKILEDKFKNKENVSIHCQSILDWNPTYKYDSIISGLPFNYFNSNTVISILHKYKQLAKENTKLCFFEYILIPEIKTLFSDSKVPKTIQAFIHKHEHTSHSVFKNLPPARVYKLSI